MLFFFLFRFQCLQSFNVQKLDAFIDDVSRVFLHVQNNCDFFLFFFSNIIFCYWMCIVHPQNCRRSYYWWLKKKIHLKLVKFIKKTFECICFKHAFDNENYEFWECVCNKSFHFYVIQNINEKIKWYRLGCNKKYIFSK